MHVVKSLLLAGYSASVALAVQHPRANAYFGRAVNNRAVAANTTTTSLMLVTVTATLFGNLSSSSVSPGPTASVNASSIATISANASLASTAFSSSVNTSSAVFFSTLSTPAITPVASVASSTTRPPEGGWTTVTVDGPCDPTITVTVTVPCEPTTTDSCTMEHATSTGYDYTLTSDLPAHTELSSSAVSSSTNAVLGATGTASAPPATVTTSDGYAIAVLPGMMIVVLVTFFVGGITFMV